MSLDVLLEHLNPKGIAQQLKPGLEAIGSSMAEYRADVRAVTNRLMNAGFVVLPELKGKHEEQSRSIVELINSLDLQQKTLIIPAEYFSTALKRASLSKKGVVLTTTRFYSRNGRRPVYDLIYEALKTERMSDIFFGIDFQGVGNDRRFRISTLFNWWRAHKAKTFLPKDVVKVNLYMDRSPVLELGGEAEVVVPSFSKEKMYVIGLYHIPVYEDIITEQAIRNSHDFCVEDTCKKRIYFKLKYWRRTIPLFGRTRRKGDDHIVDHHADVAYLYTAEKIERDTDYMVLPMFPKPQEKTEVFADKLNTQVFIESTDGVHVSRAPLGSIHPYMEMMLHKWVAFNNEKRNHPSAEPSSSEL